MQTFLPYADFAKSASVLDFRRLGKQRVEATQIYGALKALEQGLKQGWQNHPATLMWQGRRDALGEYIAQMVIEWIKRGYRNNITPPPPAPYLVPTWLGDEKLHSNHRAILLAKDPEWYGQFGWTEKPTTEYYWPLKMAKATEVK